MQIQINNQTVGLKVSMWIVDSNRLNKLIEKGDPDSTLWKFTAMFFLAYQNNCRYLRQEPTITEDDFYFWVDEQFSFREGKKKLIALMDEIREQIEIVSESPDTNGEASAAKKKKLTGALSTA